MIIGIVYKEKKLSAGAMLQALIKGVGLTLFTIKGVGLTLLVEVRGIAKRLFKNCSFINTSLIPQDRGLSIQYSQNYLTSIMQAHYLFAFTLIFDSTFGEFKVSHSNRPWT